MNTQDKKIALAKWILNSDENVLNEVEAIYKTFTNTISEEHKKILDERLEEHLKNPNQGNDWQNVKARLESKYGL